MNQLTIAYLIDPYNSFLENPKKKKSTRRFLDNLTTQEKNLSLSFEPHGTATGDYVHLFL